MRIGVMGGAGQLGRCTVSALGEFGVDPAQVVVLARSPEKAADLAEQGFELRRADYDDVESMRRAFEGIDVLYAIPTMSAPAPRCVQLQNAIDAARDRGVGRFVTSTVVGTAVGNPFAITPYLVYAEAAVRIWGGEWNILRSNYYTDPIVDWVPDIIEMGTIPYPTGEGRVAYATRADMGRAAAAVLAGRGETDRTYELTGPAALTTEELCAAVAAATGAPIEYRPCSVQDYVDICVAEGEPEPFSRLLATLYEAVAQGYTDVCTDHIEQLTGRAPQSVVGAIRQSRSA